MGCRVDIDWEAIELAYRLGHVTIHELAATHAISRAAIQKRARQKGWIRDIAERVRREVRERIVAPKVAPRVAATEIEATVKDAVDERVEINRRHQRRHAEQLEIADGISRALAVSDLPVTLRAQALNNLASANQKLTALERQAVGLSDEPEGANDIRVTFDDSWARK